MGLAAQRKLTYEQYLAIERGSAVKHEFIDGEVYAMAGGSPAHAALAVRVASALSRSFGTGPCVAFSSDLKLWIEAEHRATYADLAVVCGPLVRAGHDHDAVTNPTLLVEVLSESTEADDRGAKFGAYATLASFREYVLVDQHEPRIEVFRRNDDGSWTLYRHDRGGTVRLGSVDAQFAVDEIYAGIVLEPRRRRPEAVIPPDQR